MKENTELQVVSKQIHIDSSWFSAERDVSRTRGMHLSGVIDFIEQQEGVKRRDDADKASLHHWAAGGFLWERLLHRLIEHNPFELWDWMFGRAMAEIVNPNVVRPGEQCLDAGECGQCVGTGKAAGNDIGPCPYCGGTGRVLVFMTPDGYNIDNIWLEEWKHTSKSSKDIETEITGPKFRRWVAFQIPAYLKALNLTKCLVRVYHSRGNYTNNEPCWWEHLIEYTQQEIDETWEMIANHALIMRREGLG